MGRLAFRVAFRRDGFDICQINEIACDAAGSAHLVEFDSVQGRWELGCSGTALRLIVEDTDIAYSSNVDIAATDWSGCDLVIEATGKFKTPEVLQAYFEQGVKKVLVAAPVPGALNLVMGVNHALYDAREHHLVTAASCTTNCLAPLVKVMHETIGIKHGCITTIHDVTNTQTLVDKGHTDLRRARAAGQSLIPTSTGSARAIADIFPELKGRLNGLAVRVPLLNASLTDFVFESQRPVSREEVNGLFAEAALGDLRGILGFEERPLVSADYCGDPRSSIVDALSTMVIDDTQVKILAWYDNEWGYVNRMVELAAYIADRGMDH